IKFTDQGEVFVTVEAAGEESEDGMLGLHFVVTDTGIGIPKDKQQVIFESLVQADGSMTRRYGGNGLGLAICSQLVKLMNGRIWVESEIARGSSFHFTVRLRADQQASAEDKPQEEARRKAAHSLRILLAE